MTIKILPEALAAQIAAGEVIERPASVVKELIENAIDAGASEIRVEMRDGGKRLLRVSDNGSGIPSGEVELAFSHHATSKLNSVDDLFRITTLGFRGEALPSIAAVSQLAMLTRSADEPAGVELRLHGGRVTQREAHAAPRGTVITVENLFYNVPARLKFMKSSGSESGHINELVSRYALAYPAIRFSLTSESRLVFQSPGSGSMADVLVAVYGADTARQMVEVSAERSDAGEPGGQGRATAAVYGYLSNPALNRANRAHMVFFVNGRLVQDRSLTFSVVEAYHTLLQVGRFPLCVLKVSVPADEVDVNVHPSKAEVKFRHPGFVFSAVQRAVRATVIGQTPIPALSLPDGADRQGEAPRLSFGQLGLEVQRTAAPLSPPDADDRLHGREWLYPPADSAPESGTSRPDVPPDERDAPLPILRVLGQVARTYIIAEGPEGIFLIDQHAAHERILYEKFRRERQALGASAQSLLEPLAVDLTPRQAVRLADRMAVFTEVGFQIEPFGGATYLLRAVPSIMAGSDPRQSFLTILDELAEEDEGRRVEHGGVIVADLTADGTESTADPLRQRREAMLIASVCKQAAIKAGRVLSLPEMQELIGQLEQSQSPRTCPHGRPTMVKLGLDQLAREFGRR